MAPGEFLGLADLLPEPMILVVGTGEIVAANLAFARVVGIEQSELGGRRLTELVADSPAHVGGLLRSFSRSSGRSVGRLDLKLSAEGVRAWRCEGVLVRPPDSVPPLLLVRLAPRETTSAHFVALNRKIDELAREATRRRATEARLRESLDLLRAVCDSTTDSIYVKDLDGRYLMVNAAAARLMGRAAEEVLGRDDEVLFGPEATRAIRAVDLEVVRSGRALTFEFGAPERTMLSTNAPFRGDGGRIVGVVGISRNITDRKRVENERAHLLTLEREARSRAEEASRMKDEFLASLSHELRTPLTPIVGWARELADGISDADMIREAGATIERCALAQLRLIDDLLDVSQITSGRLKVQSKSVAFATVVRSAVEVVAPAARSKGVLLESRLPSAPCRVRGDPDRLQQVVWNLLANAIRFTPREGRVAVELAPRGGEVELVVRDTGKGISPEFLPRVFERFAREDASATSAEGGSGIGLSIVRYLVEAHGGTVVAESDGPGRGARFTIRLPAAESSPRRRAEPADL